MQKGRHRCEKRSQKSALAVEENNSLDLANERNTVSEEEREKEQNYSGVQRGNKVIKRVSLHLTEEHLFPPKIKEDKKIQEDKEGNRSLTNECL